MRNTILATLAAIALTVGPLAPPADALAPYQTRHVTFQTCHGNVMYGEYGGYPFAQFTEDTNSGCHLNTEVEVAAFTGSGTIYTSCRKWGQLFNDDPTHCFYNGRTITVLMPESTTWDAFGVSGWLVVGPFDLPNRIFYNYSIYTNP
jgi:hypothetical protein